MFAYRFNQTLFTHVIAAHSIDACRRVALPLAHLDSFAAFEQWHTPDIWTRRAVDAVTVPGIIDTIPRFVVDRVDGPVYLDIDDVPAKLSPADVISIEHDGPHHAAWLMLCIVEKERCELMRAHVARIASETNPKHYAKMARALAGAWGLGPIPEWHAAILPALIALDIETTDCVNAFGANVFEMDRAELIAELDRCALIDESIPLWCIDAMCTIESGLSAGSDAIALRTLSNKVLRTLGWLP